MVLGSTDSAAIKAFFSSTHPLKMEKAKAAEKEKDAKFHAPPEGA